MFKTVGKLVNGTVMVAGEVVRASAKAGITLTGNVVAGASEAFAGKNAFSDGVRELKDGLNKLTDKVVDVGAPIAGRVAGAPLRKAEHVKDLVIGGVQATIWDHEKGMAKVEKAAGGLALTVLTAGLVDEDNREIIGGVLDAVGDSVGDLVEAVAGVFGDAGSAAADAVDGAGDTVGDVAHVVPGVGADAGMGVDAGDALVVGVSAASAEHASGLLADAGTHSAEHAGNAFASAAAPDPHALASAPVHESVVSPALRFQGLTHAEALRGMPDEESRIAFVQHLIDNLSANTPPHVLGGLQQLQAGAWKTAEQALTDADPYVNMPTQAAGVFFG